MFQRNKCISNSIIGDVALIIVLIFFLIRLIPDSEKKKVPNIIRMALKRLFFAKKLQKSPNGREDFEPRPLFISRT